MVLAVAWPKVPKLKFWRMSLNPTLWMLLEMSRFNGWGVWVQCCVLSVVNRG